MQEADDSDKNIWSTLLSEVHANAINRHNAYGACGSTTGPQLLMLGSEQVGKSKLIASFNNSDEANSGVGLEYHCLTFKEEQQGVSETLQLGVWCLDGDPAHSNLLKFALNESTIWHTMLVICVSLTEPWYLMNELQMWLKIVQQHVVRLKLASGELKALQSSVQTYFKSYAEPVDGQNSNAPDVIQEQSTTPQRPAINSGGRRGSYFISPGADQAPIWPYTPLHPITVNDATAITTTEHMETTADCKPEVKSESTDGSPLGIPLMVVVTKTDCFDQLEKEFGFTDEHLDAIQYHLRKLCLQYQASLVYTSTKEAINTELLFRYLKHRLYDLPFTTTACLIEPTAVFIPAGWDSEHRLELLRKNLPESVVDGKFASNFPRQTKLRAKTVNKGKKCTTSDGSGRAEDALALQTAEDEQAFLARMQVQLQQMQTPSPGCTTPADGSGLVKQGSEVIGSLGSANTGPGVASCSAGIAGAGTTTIGPGSTANLSEKEAVLSNFFNSLLTRKNLGETSPNTSPTPPVSAAKSPPATSMRPTPTTAISTPAKVTKTKPPTKNTRTTASPMKETNPKTEAS